MDNIKELVAEIDAELNEIQNVINTSEEKEKFTYNNSRAIRKTALEITKLCKELRNVTQEHYRSTQ